MGRSSYLSGVVTIPAARRGALLEFVLLAAEEESARPFPEPVVDALRRVIPCDTVAYRAWRRHEVLDRSFASDELAERWSVWLHYPLFRHDDPYPSEPGPRHADRPPAVTHGAGPLVLSDAARGSVLAHRPVLRADAPVRDPQRDEALPPAPGIGGRRLRVRHEQPRLRRGRPDNPRTPGAGARSAPAQRAAEIDRRGRRAAPAPDAEGADRPRTCRRGRDERSDRTRACRLRLDGPQAPRARLREARGPQSDGGDSRVLPRGHRALELGYG